MASQGDRLSASPAVAAGKEVAHPDVTDLEVIEPEIERIVDQKIELRMERYAGPMPHPDHLARYDRIVPGCARMIMDEFQANSRHARELELLGLSKMVQRDTRAQWMAYTLVLGAFGLIWWATDHGHEKVAITIAAVLVGTIITGFLATKKQSKSSPKPPVKTEADLPVSADPDPQ
ncbi:DUF2335 domain-containing protein [Burkholderia gladioli]|uniref:DUF2335 domain-containing protein n=1 Tax=Burkholderia gladioli TaxID=28095 RepID=UPI00163E6E8E|nr:DUF2335 domain-containing protein [Burkholderia gladioli]